MIEELLNEVVVLDMSSPFVFVGTLTGQTHDYLVLDDVDVHDLRDTSTTREQYVADCRRLGPTPNRRRAWVRLEHVVGISRLSDVALH